VEGAEMNAVSVDGITVKAGRKVLLDNFSCEIGLNEFLVVIGPNGAGKTTLLRAICGLSKVQSGKIVLYGKPFKTYSRRKLASTMALVPQNMHIEFSFTVEETVLMGRYPYLGMLEQEKKEDYEIARQAMEFTQVDHLATRRLDQLSGGEGQRVIIARSICQQPKMMLLDEPTAALDPSHQLSIMKLMQKFRQEKNTTVVMVSHDLNLAGLFASRILLVKEGKVVTSGSPTEILVPQNLQEVYGCPMHVDSHPITGTPRVSLVP
jgi:iron complex transport system ATP-binding protein